MARILVTGGTGYIGSHTTVELMQQGYDVTIVDNLSNSSIDVLDGIAEIVGRKPEFANIDCGNFMDLDNVFRAYPDVVGVIHFAASKAVGESVEKPLLYYRNNLGSLCTLLEVMKLHQVPNIVFSSSCTVYGQPDAAHLPVDETAPIQKALSPYGNTKQINEEIICDEAHADKNLQATILRYFNPIGAHPSGLIGEDPAGIPNNLLPYVAQVAIGRRPELNVFGNDYPTPDGTGVRDFIHVVDLAIGHLKAIEKLEREPHLGLKIYNLGTGKGYSVLQVVKAFEKASKRPVPYRICPRRSGDIAECWADPSLARKELGWVAERGIDEMCRDAWNWQRKNPYGYTKPKA